MQQSHVQGKAPVIREEEIEKETDKSYRFTGPDTLKFYCDQIAQ
jgi:hypothetical protein